MSARLAVSALLLLLAGAARAQVAPADSLLHDYMGGLRDSTDAWFHAATAPVDTAGLDSALAAGLAKKPVLRGGVLVTPVAPKRTLALSWSPAVGFDRVDGAKLGGEASVSAPFAGRFSGRAQYTTGAEDVIGEGAWSGTLRVPGRRERVSLRLAAGRWTEAFDRDHYSPFFSSLLALTSGSDRHQYLRRDGFRARLAWNGRDDAELSVGWRNELESPRPFTTRWTLFGGEPELLTNRAAAFGRASELSFAAGARIPGTRFRGEARYWTSDPRMGSDFRYRRLTLASGGDVSLGRHFALVPQASWSRLRGQTLPQDALFLGGAYNLRTFERNDLEGAGRTFARTDLVLVDELAQALHLPLPAMMPMRVSGFVASGAAWGRDPITSEAAPTRRDWPRANEWRSEAGVSLLWRLGIPEPNAGLRFEYAIPIGGDARDVRFVVGYQGLLTVVRGE